MEYAQVTKTVYDVIDLVTNKTLKVFDSLYEAIDYQNGLEHRNKGSDNVIRPREAHVDEKTDFELF